MQLIAYCRQKLRNASHLKTKYALPEIRKGSGNRSESGVSQEFAASPCDIGIAKAAAAQELCPELRLLVLEPFNVGGQRVPNSQVAKNVTSRGIHDDELASWLHHGGNVAEDVLVLADRVRRVEQGDTALFIQMVDGSQR
jgi:hypothetical protein